ESFAKGIPKDSLPPEEICQVIEDLKSKDLEEGFYIATRNRRGVTTRALFEGGGQEKELAKHYVDLSKKIEFSYPRTAKVLKEIAKSYEHDAKREDVRAKEDELEY
ncbi:MAG: hypothetical protein ACRDFC_02305, partial [Ignavibacteria bacterium]